MPTFNDSASRGPIMTSPVALGQRPAARVTCWQTPSRYSSQCCGNGVAERGSMSGNGPVSTFVSMPTEYTVWKPGMLSAALAF